MAGGADLTDNQVLDGAGSVRSDGTDPPGSERKDDGGKLSPSSRRHTRILPVLILAAVTAVGFRALDFVRNDGITTLLAGDGVDLGPGRPLMAQDAVDDAEGVDSDLAAMPEKMMEEDQAIDETAQTAMISEGEDLADDDLALMTAQEAMEQVDLEDAGLGSEELSETEIDLLMSLSERRRALEDKEADLDGREALLRATEMRVDEKVAELDQAKLEIEMLIGKLDEAEEARLARLVQVYEIMKPAEAAKIFDGLERDVLLQVMERMGERKLAPILAGMNPVLARELTADLALRRRLPDLPES